MPYTNLFGSFPGHIIVGTVSSIEETRETLAATLRAYQGRAGTPIPEGKNGSSAGLSLSLGGGSEKPGEKREGTALSTRGKGGIITLDSGEIVPYDVVILATGAVWEGIVAFPNKPEDYLTHVESWRKRFKDANEIVIAGGGPVGVGELLGGWNGGKRGTHVSRNGRRDQGRVSTQKGHDRAGRQASPERRLPRQVQAGRPTPPRETRRPDHTERRHQRKSSTIRIAEH